jgi:hypothetical protein
MEYDYNRPSAKHSSYGAISEHILDEEEEG